jgi:hypothetical protein
MQGEGVVSFQAPMKLEDAPEEEEESRALGVRNCLGAHHHSMMEPGGACRTRGWSSRRW